MINAPFIRFIIVVAVVLTIIYLLPFNCSKHTNDKQNMAECYKLADKHWSKADYYQWLIDSIYYSNPDVNYENVCDTFWYWDKEKQEKVYFSHHLPDIKNQQYYEMIGKYEQFRYGWDDYDPITHSSPHRESYLKCCRRASGTNKLSPTEPDKL